MPRAVEAPGSRDGVARTAAVGAFHRRVRWAAAVLGVFAVFALLSPAPAQAQSVGAATPSAPTLPTSVVTEVQYGSFPINSDERFTPPSGSAAWRLGFQRVPPTSMFGFTLNATTANVSAACATGTTFEYGWYENSARTTKVSTDFRNGNQLTPYKLNATAGEYCALAYCKSGSTYSTPVNLMRGGSVRLNSTGAATGTGCGTTTETPITNTPGNFEVKAHRGKDYGIQLSWDPIPKGQSYHYQWKTPGGAWSRWTAAWANTSWSTATRFHHMVWNEVLPGANKAYVFRMRANVGHPKYDQYNPRYGVPTAEKCVVHLPKTGTATATCPTGQGVPEGGASVSLSVDSATVEEGSPVEVTATLSAALGADVSIPVTVTRDTSEEDHDTLSSITVSAGQTSGSAPIVTHRDADGDDETFTVAVDAENLPALVVAGDPSSVTVTVDDTGEYTVVEPDPLFPAAPLSVEATPGDGEVALAWSAVAGAAGWEVERDGSGTWTDTGSADRSWTVTGLVNGTEYRFRVRATGLFPALKGEASASVSATPQLQAQAALPARPAWVRMRWEDNGDLLVWWPEVEPGVTYEVTRADGNGAVTHGPLERSRTNAGIAGLAKGETHVVRVTAKSATAGKGEASEPAAWWPPAPANVTASVVEGSDRGVADATLSWGAVSGAAKYRYRVKKGDEAAGAWTEVAGGATSVTVSALERNAAYGFEVEAHAPLWPGGRSEWSAQPGAASLTVPLLVPPPPSWVRMRWEDNGDLLVWWPEVEPGLTYEVTREDGSGTVTHGPVERTRTNAGIAGLDRSGTHVVRVTAKSAAAGKGEASEPAAWWPPAPANVAASVVQGSNGVAADVALSWDEVSGAGKYRYRVTKGGAAAAWVEVTGGAVSDTVSGLERGAEYRFEVEAHAPLYPGGRSEWSARPGVTTLTVPAPALAVADATAAEPGAGGTASLDFTVTLAPAAAWTVTVDYATRDGTAAAGEDYTAASGTLTFAPGETAKTVAVAVLADAHDDGGETLTLALSNASGATISDAEATGTITNDDPMPKAWTARFGRTAWEHTLAAVEQRLRSARTPATRAAVAGHELTAPAGVDPVADEQRIAALAAWIDHGAAPAQTMSAQELIAGSAFQAATAAGPDGDALTVWGQGAYGRFEGRSDGRDGDLSVHGQVAGGTLGVDWATGPWLAGLALSHSSGWGGYAQTSGGEVTGTVSSEVTGAFPYLAVEAVPERLSLWAAGGYGIGGMRLTPGDDESLETSIDLLAGAAGVRGTVVPASVTGGFSLAVNADGLLLRATSEEVSGLAATTADVNRGRVGLEGAYEAALGGGGRLTPSVEVGVRRDGGDAETGFGLDLGGGLSYAHAGLGLSLGLNGRALVLHEAGKVAEWGASGWLVWDPSPGSELGPALTVSPSLGASAAGGAAALWSGPAPAGPDGGAVSATGSGRVDVKFGYGLPLAGGVVAPWAGVDLADGERGYRLGSAFHAGGPSATDLRIDLVAARREPAGVAPEHTLSIESTLNW